MFSEYNFRNYNFRLLFYVLALNLVGVVVINSAVGGDRSYVNRQLIGMFGGLMLAIAISLMDYRKLMKCCGLVYIGCVGILLAVIVAGQLGCFGGGSRRWIDLPVIGRFQPSEFVKIGLIFFFSWFLQKNQEKINRPSVLVTAAVLAALPKGCLIVDLASKPGGTDFAAARRLGHTALHALSLPTVWAPETAGEALARTVQAILQEREGTI